LTHSETPEILGGMQFPNVPEERRVRRLEPPAAGPRTPPLRMVLDTDTFNEVDDQFAFVYALRSTERLRVEAVYAAPFLNDRASGPGDGMEKSHEEILRLLGRMKVEPSGLAHRGSTSFLTDGEHPVSSPAALDLVERAMATPRDGDPLYVVAIGAITNVASAILLAPGIIDRIVVVWLGGHPVHFRDTSEFNLKQDLAASRLVLDCGVPLVRVPCLGVASHLLTTVAELETHLRGKNPVCDYLVDTVRGYRKDHFAWAKEIWDIATIGWMVDPQWVPTTLDHSPVLSDRLTWSVDKRRHLIRSAYFVHRNPIFADLFRKIAA
jgi:purine nucleosidase